MKQLPKILLVASVTGFALSLTSFGSAIHYGMLKPVSAILFIVFFILKVVEKEVEKYDAEIAANSARFKNARLLNSKDFAKPHKTNERLAIAH